MTIERPSFDPPPAPAPPSPGTPAPMPDVPEPGGEPAHDPPLSPEHDVFAEHAESPEHEVIFDENGAHG